MVSRMLSSVSPQSAVIRAPDWLMIVLSVLAVLYSVMPLVEMRLPNAIEALFALTGLYTLFRYGVGVRWSLPVKLMAAGAVIMVVSWLFMIIDHPELARSGPSLEDLLDKFFFLFIALAIAREEKRGLVFLGIFGLFVILMPWLSGGGVSDIMAGFEGVRAGFGINPIRTGLLFGAVFLGLISFAPRLFMRPRFSMFRFLIWAVVLAFCVAIVVLSQSRTAMVALVPGLVIAFGLFLFLSSVDNRQKLKVSIVVVTGFLVLILVAYLAGLSSLIETRFGEETVVIEQIIDGDLEDIPKTSWGIRVHLLAEGINGFLERPWTGWGYRAGEIILDKDGLRRGDGGVFSQVHNTYLEAALRYGVGGAIILFALFGWAVEGCLKAQKRGDMSLDLAVFLGASLGYLMVASLFDGLLFQTEGVLLFNVLMGVVGSFVLFEEKSVRDKEETVHDYAT